MATIYVPDIHERFDDEQFVVTINNNMNDALGRYDEIMENVKIERAITVLMHNANDAIFTFIPDENKRPVYHVGRVGYKQLVPLEWTGIRGDLNKQLWKLPPGHPPLETFEGVKAEELMAFSRSLAFTAFANYVGSPKEYREEHRIKDVTQRRMRKVGAYVGSRAVIVNLDEPVQRQSSTHNTDTGIKKCHHECKGHWRTYKSGKVVWVKAHWRGDKALGTVHKQYETMTQNKS